METVSWIRFTLHGKSDSGLTNRWRIHRINGTDVLGVIAWHAPWRKYTMFAVDGTIFDAICLRDIADFCEQQTQEHKKI
jgi:hypothetical protein